MKMKIKFYTLLYIDLEEKRTLQGAERTGLDRLKIFVQNSVLLDRSIRNTNSNIDGVTILTNRGDIIQGILSEMGYDNMSYIDIPFSLDVPKGIKFYSAHYKIDVFGYLSTRSDDEYSILLDNDIVALKALPSTFWDIAYAKIPMCYRINETNCDRIQTDCRKVDSDIPVVEWLGGEFIAGDNKFYENLYNRCFNIAPRYFRKLDENLFHIGDEVLTSMSMSMMTNEGIRIIDAGAMGFIYRYWGMHEREPLAKYDPVFAHFPADKVWLASLSNAQFTPPDFCRKYNKHWALFKYLLKIKKLIGRH